MPTYEYECQKCGHRFEDFASMTAKPLTHCPKCRGKVKRLIGAGAAPLFKGSGFYQTDYRSSSYQAKKKSDSDSGGGGGAAEPAKKTEPKALPAAKDPPAKKQKPD
jgi:putative FmdB family regulatory protein